MLALQRRQHLPYSHPTHTSPLPPSPPHSHSLSFDELSQQLSTLSAQGFYNNQKLLNDYLESQQQSFATHTPVIVNNDISPDASQFMTDAYNFSNPAIRIQQSTPTPQPSNFAQQPMIAANSHNWNSFADNGQMDTQSLQTTVQNQAGQGHQRASSSSSIGSNGSQFQAVNASAGYPSFSNHLPTPTHTPTQDSFLNQSFNNNTNFTPNTNPGLETTMAAHLSMKQALMDQHATEDDLPGFGHSARHSVSSYGQDSPATPHTQQGDDFEDKLKAPATDMRTIPKFERTYTDVELDNLYNSSMVAQIPHSAPQVNPSSGSLLLSPWRPGNNGTNNVAIRNALQAAEHARSQSPSSSVSRGVSPFRQNSPYHAPSNSFNSPRMRTAAQTREAQKAEADAFAMKQMPQNEDAQVKTISPKEALLDYRETDEDAKMPLFPESGASEYESQYNGGNQYSNATQSNFDTTSAQKFRQDSWATTPQYSSTFSTSTAGPSPPQSSFNFVPPSISGNMHGLPFTTSQYRATSNMPSATEPTPEFPAHLTSMESSASEAGPESSQVSGEAIQKPAATNADTGTYTCTYHGCTLRFETPQKLQKHKREGHRNNPNPTPANMGSGMTSAALLERNSQAGPHKCERINPTTGKPCNTIFSRPYDLTRHEDTIHNARKQKVRCALCVEEKTFSRNDALTRHMRVCHPEIDFPGKHKRRGGNHD